MKRLILVFTLAVTVSLLAIAANGVKPSIFYSVDNAAMEAWVEAQLASMSPEQRVAQLMVMGVDPKDDESTRALIRRYVSENRVGGLIYNESTLAEQLAVTNYAQSQATVPLMITIDGEWGLAMRVDGAPNFPRNLILGAVNDDKLLYQYGREVARELRRVGIHVNFAPVLDVNDNPNNPVIGTRSFGESPEIVSRHAIAYARGLEDGGVLSVGKHFPGHGSSIEDSHKTLPLIDKSMKEINTCELIPFRNYIAAGLSGILTAHLNVPAIDNSGRPTTMSHHCVTDLLKEQLGFEGLVFTDALSMEGAKRNISGSPCVNALLAGNDVLLMPANADAEVRAVMDAIAAGILKQSDIDEHCRKMLRYKYALGLTSRQQVATQGVEASIKGGKANALLHELAGATVTVLKNHDKTLPLRNLQSHRIAVVTMGDERGKASPFASRAEDYANVKQYSWRVGESVTTLLQSLATDKYDEICVGVCNADALTCEAVSMLVKQCKNVVLAIMCKPYEIERLGKSIVNKHVKATLLTYQNTDLAQDYAMQTIFGGNAARGILPISLKCGPKTYHAGEGVQFDACRLGYGTPSEVGINDRLLSQIDSVARLGVREKAFPGCQVLVARHGKIVCQRSYGEIDYGSGIPVTDKTLFGLASVSKATGTLSAVMKLYDDGKIKLDEPVSRVITDLRDGDKADLTFRDLLYHETGMPASLNMWTMMMDPSSYTGVLVANAADDNHTIKIMNGAWGHKDARLRTDILSTHQTDRFNIAIADGLWGGRVTYDSIMQRIYHSELRSKKYLYSCLNFCLLADAVQRITKSPLNYFVNSNIFAPLGAYRTLYRPLSRFDRNQIAYTEVDTYLRRQHIHGYVHDELAAFSGGVQGNAGLFSNAADLAKLFQMWLNGGTYGGIRFYKPSTVETFTTQKSANSHRGLGFDKPVVGDPEASNTCPEATPETYGHTGFTGTCFWVDPKNDMFYIFLSNRVSPTRNNAAFSRISARSHIATLIYKNLVE